MIRRMHYLMFLTFLCTTLFLLSSSMQLINETRAVHSHATNYHLNKVLKTIWVGPSEHAQFRSIQAAINSIPTHNPNWTCIRVLAGVYREKVTVNKPYLIIKGAGKRRTLVVWDDHKTLEQSATFTVMADNFVAKGISFINSYNLPEYGGDKNERVPAAAAYIAGDKCTFIRCGFVGVQDTLWDVGGRHYFHRSTIVGSVDFILGSGQSIYENCVIFVLGGVLDQGTPGYITTQSRTSPNDENGFVFKGGIIIGKALTYLGRAWGPYARVLFYNTTMTDIVVPQGWDSWTSAGQEYKLTFAESDCRGPGAKQHGRVQWEKKLSQGELTRLTSLDYINSDKWLFAQPVYIH